VRWAGVAAACACLVACSSSAPSPTTSTTSAPAVASTTTVPGGTATSAAAASSPATAAPREAVAAAWPTYNRTADRDGLAPGAPRPAGLAPAWSRHLDGAVYGQPLVVGGSVIAATENDSVYALALASGAVEWRTNLGVPVPTSQLPCGDIDPLGITGTPVYDAVTGSVFVVAETTGGSHNLVALDAGTGKVRWTANLDVGGHDRRAQQQRGALALANGRVYVAFGGLFGDCGDYVGYVTATPTSGNGTTLHYDVPTAREGGIWASSGPAVAADGTVYVAVGNGAADGGAYDGSDAVLRLAPDLSSRLDYFAPAGWAQENAGDVDLGSAGPVLVAGGLLVQSGKDGRVYVLDASHLGGIGGARASAGGCAAFGGLASDGDAVFVPCTDGVRRFDVTATSVTPRWHVGVTGPPVVGGGAVWSMDTGRGVLHAYDEGSGANLASAHIGSVTRFTAPIVVGNDVLVGTRSSVVVLHIVAAG
jgi:outer membrane protein assembly factor BamB